MRKKYKDIFDINKEEKIHEIHISEITDRRLSGRITTAYGTTSIKSEKKFNNLLPEALAYFIDNYAQDDCLVFLGSAVEKDNKKDLLQVRDDILKASKHYGEKKDKPVNENGERLNLHLMRHTKLIKIMLGESSPLCSYCQAGNHLYCIKNSDSEFICFCENH